jgi:Domain of unknown function (DUF4402)
VSAGWWRQCRTGRAPAEGDAPFAGVLASGGAVSRAWRRGTLLGLALACGVAGVVSAQRRIRVTGQRSLTFGTLLPGINHTVLRTDPLNSGMFDIRAARFSQVQLVFSLPTVMRGPGGATLPLSFGAGDAGFSATQSVSNQVGFDPRTAFVTNFGLRARATVFLGGTARPQPSQRAGSYSGTVTLTVVYLP